MEARREATLASRPWRVVAIGAAASAALAAALACAPGTAQAAPVAMQAQATAAAQATSGSWRRSGGRWWYRYADGSYARGGLASIGGRTYLFDSSGWMLTGWQRVSGKWYCFASSGAMRKSTWVGNYYLGKDGAMLTSCKTPDGYWVDASGKWVGYAGWKKSGARWWYMNANGSYPANEFKKISGKWYLFDKSGWMKTGWQKFDGKWYYLASSGAMATSRWVGSYYVGRDGAMLTSTVTPDGWRVLADGRWDGGGRVSTSSSSGGKAGGSSSSSSGGSSSGSSGSGGSDSGGSSSAGGSSGSGSASGGSSGGSGSSSGSGSTSTNGHWVGGERVWVVDAAAWDEEVKVYKEKFTAWCNDGFTVERTYEVEYASAHYDEIMEELMSIVQAHIQGLTGGGLYTSEAKSETVLDHVDVIHHDEVGHWETTPRYWVPEGGGWIPSATPTDKQAWVFTYDNFVAFSRDAADDHAMALMRAGVTDTECSYCYVKWVS